MQDEDQIGLNFFDQARRLERREYIAAIEIGGMKSQPGFTNDFARIADAK